MKVPLCYQANFIIYFWWLEFGWIKILTESQNDDNAQKVETGLSLCESFFKVRLFRPLATKNIFKRLINFKFPLNTKSSNQLPSRLNFFALQQINRLAVINGSSSGWNFSYITSDKFQLCFLDPQLKRFKLQQGLISWIVPISPMSSSIRLSQTCWWWHLNFFAKWVQVPQDATRLIKRQNNLATNNLETNNLATNNLATNNLATNNLATNNLATNNLASNYLTTNNLATNNLPTNNLVTNNLATRTG